MMDVVVMQCAPWNVGHHDAPANLQNKAGDIILELSTNPNNALVRLPVFSNFPILSAQKSIGFY